MEYTLNLSLYGADQHPRGLDFVDDADWTFRGQKWPPGGPRGHKKYFNLRLLLTNAMKAGTTNPEVWIWGYKLDIWGSRKFSETPFGRSYTNQ